MIKWREILTWEWYSHSHDIFTHKISYNFFFNMIVTITDRCIQECKHEIQLKKLCIVPEDHSKDKSPDCSILVSKIKKAIMAGTNITLYVNHRKILWKQIILICDISTQHATVLRGTKAKMFQVFNLFTYTVY